MNDYRKQAKDFCKKWNVSIDFEAVGIESATWDDKPTERLRYKVTIKRLDHGDFTIDFGGSINELEQLRLAMLKKHNKPLFDKFKEAMQPHLRTKLFYKDTKEEVDWFLGNRNPVSVANKILKGEAYTRDLLISEYDVLAGIETYFEGSLDDFIEDFGFEGAKTLKEWRKLEDTYNEVVRQFTKIKRMFPEQEAFDELTEIA